jgi:hypothetical protein
MCREYLMDQQVMNIKNGFIYDEGFNCNLLCATLGQLS